MKTKLTNFLHISRFAKSALVMLVWIPALLLVNPVNSVAGSGGEAEPIVVTGIITSGDDGEPLIGATVSIKGTTKGTVTDVFGKYSIETDTDAILVFSYIGHKTAEKAVTGTKMDLVMEADIAQLEAVVIIGYGEQKKSHLTGSVSKVTNEQLDQIPIARVDDALVGQVAGVNIQMTNPAAGEAPSIRVRGQGSISFDSNPLIVVDGIAVGNDGDFLTGLDMNDVASIEVLKDAASSAIYGSRGANGIILITTKEGKEGFNLSYNTYIGVKTVPKTDVLSSVSSWSDFVKANNGGQLTNRMKYIEKLGTTTDWEEIMMDGGMITSHALSASGGTKKTKFRASLSYLNDEGVLLTDNFKKINFRLNLDTKISDRLSWGTVINPSYTEQRRFPIGVHDGLRQNPWLPLYLDANNIQYVNRHRENGRWANAQIGDYAMERMFDDYDLEGGAPSTGSGTDISSTSNQSALAKVLERDRRRYKTKIFANTNLRYKIMDGLTFKQSVGGDFRYSRSNNWTGVTASRNGAGDSESTRDTGLELHLVSESTLNFKKNFGDHDVNAVVGIAFESWDREYSSMTGSGYQFDYIQTIPSANLVGGDTFEDQETLLSYLSRVNYSYKDKYLLSVSARADGSSKFGPNNKYGFFPAVSAGWRISEEAFLADNEIISELKLRASYGVTGSNAGIGAYDHIGKISPVGTALAGGLSGFNPDNIANKDLGWEQLVEFNPGVDASFLNGRFSMTFDYYVRTSKDLLLNLPVPSVTGFGSALVNKGIVENKGFELEFRSKNIRTEDFTWSSSLLFTHNKNTLVDFAGAEGLISVVDSKRPAEWIALKGQPVSTFYGYVVEKEIPLESLRNPFYPINAQSQDIYVKDLNGDGVIDTDDRTNLGSPYPALIWSLSNNIEYKDFDLSFMFQGSHGAKVRNISSQYINNEFSSNQDYATDFADADLVVQRIFTNDDVQDASYVALRNINIGYTLPASLLSARGIKKMRVYVGAQNLLYMMSADYTGYNPEGIDQGLGNPLTYGYQRGPAPIYRTVSAGLNLSF